MAITDKLKSRNLKHKTRRNPSHILAGHAVEAILSKKGREISVMDMRKVTGVADYFVLCTGDSDAQIKAIADAVKTRIIEHCEEKPWRSEGYDHLQWVLLDYVDIIVHLFDGERRSYYDLERLWGDAPIEHVTEDAAEVSMLQE